MYNITYQVLQALVSSSRSHYWVDGGGAEEVNLSHTHTHSSAAQCCQCVQLSQTPPRSLLVVTLQVSDGRAQVAFHGQPGLGTKVPAQAGSGEGAERPHTVCGEGDGEVSELSLT